MEIATGIGRDMADGQISTVGQFDRDGFVTLRGFWDEFDLYRFGAQLRDLFHMQARKIGEYRTWVDAIVERDGPAGEQLAAIIETLEERDKEALYQVQKMLPSCQRLRSLFTPGFMLQASDLIGSIPATTLVDGPAIFVNRPRTERLLYKIHSEAHYYPKRRRFLNVWFPLFDKKTKANGAMSIWPGSHKVDWPFAEYTGYNKDTEGKRNHFVQFEVPRNMVEDRFNEHVCETEPGDVVLFDRNLLHTSNPNTTDRYSFAVVARVWDPSDDLTLSGNLAVTPYSGNDVGRADLVVRP